MNDGVNTEQILQAITELSEQLNQTEKNLNDKIEKNAEAIAKNAEKIDNFEAKFSILSDSLLHTQAEMKRLKDAQ